MSTPDMRTALVSAVTAIVTALITAGATAYSASKSASKSAETARVQAAVATTAAGQSQARVDSLVPQGAVVAFQGECPNGWLRYDAANGRVVVGADDSLKPGVSGGRPDIVFEYIGEGQYGTTGTGSYRPSQNQTSVTNGDKVMHVGIMPPFVALRMCVKQ
jgi:hypothetical protein